MNDKDRNTPEGIKQRVFNAYAKAVQSNMFMSRSGSGIEYMLRGIKLYGHDAGVDFVQTNLDAILEEAVAEAGCRKISLSIPTHGFGRAAVAGMASRLGELTAMKVDANASSITLTWASNAPQMF